MGSPLPARLNQPDISLRRCISCGRALLGKPQGLCPRCKAATVSPELAASFAAPILGGLVPAGPTVPSAELANEMAGKAIRTAIWTLIGFSTCGFGLLLMPLFGPAFGGKRSDADGPGGLAGLLCVAGLPSLLPQSAPSVPASQLEALNDKFVQPFLERSLALVNRSVLEDSEETQLLRRLLKSKGFPAERLVADTWSAWAPFFHAAVLGRLYRDFEERIDRVAGDAGRPSERGVGAFVRMVRDPAEQLEQLPLLYEYLRRRGEVVAPKELLARIGAENDSYRLWQLEQNLAQRHLDLAPLTMDEIDEMPPFNFEILLGLIYSSLGFHCTETPKTGDQGADLFIEKNGVRSVVQAKLYSTPVGNKAVQEVIAARQFFGCQRAMVITNNYFTASAMQLAAGAQVELIDRQLLEQLVDLYNERPFDMARARRLLRAA